MGESSVWYLYSRLAATEISKFSPSSRIIIMLRNPIDVLPSMFSARVFDGFEDIPDWRLHLRLMKAANEG